jgi:hypothetical protein
MLILLILMLNAQCSYCIVSMLLEEDEDDDDADDDADDGA